MSDAIEAALTAYRETATYPIVPGNHSEAMTAALTAYEAAKSGGVGVAALLDAYDAETSKLPLGHETPSHGRSTFNWRRAVVAELRDLSATLALTSPASGERDAWAGSAPFITSESGGGEYVVHVKVHSMDELHAAHVLVLEAFGAKL